MRAEIAKVRYLPTPRWTAAVLAAITLIVGLVLIVVAPSNPDKYVSVPQTVTQFTVWIATLLFGVWLSTLDFGSGTMQRTLTAEPDRNRVLAAKLIVVLVAAAAAGLAVAAAAGGLSHVAANRAGINLDDGDLAGALFGQAPAAVAAAAIGFGFGLLSRSLGGGIAIGMLFVLVLSGIVSFVPGIEDYTYTQLTNDLTNGISGDGGTVNGLGASIVGTVLWCALIVAAGWVQFVRQDHK